MFTARCSKENCAYEVMDESFDRIVDALANHHYDAHGVYMDGDGPLASSWNYEPAPPAQPTGRKKKAT